MEERQNSYFLEELFSKMHLELNLFFNLLSSSYLSQSLILILSISTYFLKLQQFMVQSGTLLILRWCDFRKYLNQKFHSASG